MAGLLARIEARASLEDPSFSLSNPPDWAWDVLGGGPTKAGTRVNETTAMRLAAVFACIKAVSTDLAQQPWQLFERKGLDRERAEGHALLMLLRRPNPWMTPMVFLQTMTAHLVGWGNAYSEIETDVRGRPIALWPLLPDRTEPKARADKSVVYETRLPDGQTVPLPADRVLHVRGLGFDGLKGYSVLRMAREVIGSVLAAEEFSARLFTAAMPKMALSHPKELKPDARKRLRDDFEREYGGLSNAHRVAVLEEGMKVEKLGLDANDAQFVASARFGIEEICRFFDVPPTRIHHTEKATQWGTGLEQFERGYRVHSLRPWMTLWEQSVNWSLLLPTERDRYYVEFLDESMMQADLTAQADFVTKLLATGAISPNQIARMMNLPGFGTPGDERFVPLNMVPLSQAILPPEPPPVVSGPAPPPDERSLRTARQRRAALAKSRIQRAQLPAMQSAAASYVRKEVRAIKAAIKKASGARSVSDFQAQMEQFYLTLPETIRRAMGPVLRGYFELLVGALGDEIGALNDQQLSDLTRTLHEFEQAMIDKHIRISRESLAKRLAEGGDDVWARVAEHAERWEESRADSIASLTSVEFSGRMSEAAYRLANIFRMLSAKTTAVDCEVCDPLDGQVVRGYPPWHSDCDCQLVAG